MSDIEEDMQYFIQDIDILINNIINMQERTATGIVTVRQPLIVKIYSLLNNYKRLELRVKELEEEKQKYIVQLTDEQYRNLVDIIRKEAKQEFEQKVKDEIETLRKMLKATMKGILQEYTPEEIIIKINTLEGLLEESK